MDPLHAIVQLTWRIRIRHEPNQIPVPTLWVSFERARLCGRQNTSSIGEIFRLSWHNQPRIVLSLYQAFSFAGFTDETDHRLTNLPPLRVLSLVFISFFGITLRHICFPCYLSRLAALFLPVSHPQSADQGLHASSHQKPPVIGSHSISGAINLMQIRRL